MTGIDFEFRELTRCTREEKLGCLPLIDEMVGLAQLARREGYLAFEKSIENCDNVLLKTGLELMVDGHDKFTVQYSLADMIQMSDTTGVELLKQYIIETGLLNILNGYHPYLIRRCLTMLLGEEIYGAVMTPEWANQDLPGTPTSEGAESLADINEYWENFENKELWEKSENKEYWIEHIKKETAKYKGNPEFENIAKLHNWTIWRILWEANNADIAVALKFCSADIKNALLSNTSKRVRATIEDDMRIMGPVRARDALEAQERIVKAAIKLENMGEIIRRQPQGVNE